MLLRLGIVAAVIIGMATNVGCLSTQVRLNHTQQAKSLTSVYEDQVLDNIAMFVEDPNALPFFMLPGAGSVSVGDNTSLGVSTLNGPARSVLGPLSLARDNRNTLAMQPITDPDKLQRMQCLYQQAIYNDLLGFIYMERAGRAILKKPFGKTGQYRGSYIRVLPESYALLTQLVLQIMDIAVNDPPSAPVDVLKDVKVYLDALGNPTSKENAEQVVEAQVPIGTNREDTLEILGINKVGANNKLETTDPATFENANSGLTTQEILNLRKRSVPRQKTLRSNSPFEQRILFDAIAPSNR